MPDVRHLMNGAEGSLAMRSDGPPNYSGEHPHRMIVEGDPAGFRLLAEILLAMAEAVESDPGMRSSGWSLVLDPEAVGPLRLDAGHLLSLNCDPDRTGDGSDKQS